MTEPIRCAARCSQYPDCQHDWRIWKELGLSALEESAKAGITNGWLAAVAERIATAVTDDRALRDLFDMTRRLDTTFAIKREVDTIQTIVDLQVDRRALAAIGEIVGALRDRLNR